jgi:hypothetical protein
LLKLFAIGSADESTRVINLGKSLHDFRFERLIAAPHIKKWHGRDSGLRKFEGCCHRPLTPFNGTDLRIKNAVMAGGKIVTSLTPVNIEHTSLI